MTDREKNIEKIRAACVAANPERDWEETIGEFAGIELPCRLADVLLATPKIIYLKTLGYTVRLSDENGPVYWDCRADSLTQQSDETLAFIASLV